MHTHDIKEAFALFDKNGDGTISIDELALVVRSLGLNPTLEELQGMLVEVDVDETGTVDFNEFAAMMGKKLEVATDEEAEVREAFRAFDSDGNGFVSLKELSHAMANVGEKLTEEQVKDMLKHADVDGDGKINYAEFTRVLLAK